MEFLPDILADDDPYVEVCNAYSLTPGTVFALIEVRDGEEEEKASALLKITLGADPTYEVLHEFNAPPLDYYAESADLHYMLASGGYLHVLKNGEVQVFPYQTEEFLDRLEPMAPGVVAMFGERGEVWRYENGRFAQIPTGTQETLFGMHLPRPDHGYLVGNYGTVLRWDGAAFTQVEVMSHDFYRDVHVPASGPVLLAGIEGLAQRLGEDEVFSAEGPEADLLAVAEFKGVEYWGDDDYGVYLRDGDALVPTFPTGYAFHINTTPDLMTVNAGYDVYVFDGETWQRLRFNPSMDNLVERVPEVFDDEG